MLLLKPQNEENVFYESSWKNLSNFWLTLLNVTFVLKRSLRTLKNKIVPGLKTVYYMHVFQKEELEQFLSRNVYCLDIF